MNLDQISKQQFARESQVMAEMVSYLDGFNEDNSGILRKAYQMVESARNFEAKISVESFLNKYNLSTKEGVALMCLAEALLRIPDSETANKLIESTFEETNWKQYLKDEDSFYFNASSWGMLLTGKTIEIGSDAEDKPFTFLRNVFRKTSEPVIRKALKAAMHLVALQFVMGQTIDKALAKASKYEKMGYIFSYDILGEGARSTDQAETYFESYKAAIHKIGKYHSKNLNQDPLEKSGVSIKLTALHPRYELIKKERVFKELLPKIVELLTIAKEYNLTVSIDAEEARRLDLELEIFGAICKMPEFVGWSGIGFVLQAYQKRSFYVIEYLANLAKETNRIIPIRLVKGAYWDSEIKFAQSAGLEHFPVFTNKYHSDVAYLACAKKLFENSDSFFPQFATHNAHSIAAIRQYAGDKKFELQRLYGMGESLYCEVVKEVPCRIYAPIGRHKDLLAYLIRRLLENGANSSFANMLLDKEIPVEKIIEDPIAKVKAFGGFSNETIARPSKLYGSSRENSKGIDFGNVGQFKNLQEELVKFTDSKWNFENEALSGNVVEIFNPSEKSQIVGTIKEGTEENVIIASKKAHKAFENWKNVDVKIRADILRKTADLIEENHVELMALCIKEAGKTINDAVAEIREAVDFCRYYAFQAEKLMGEAISLPGITGETNQLSLHPKGVFACISPWNFPLAIFAGQIMAALATGNTVIAKPAEQTPLIASKMVELCHLAGIPKDVLQLITGKGAIVGSALIKQEEIKGVCFTGSTATAKNIQRALADRPDEIITLIAETGGQNSMIADSSTLPEQLVDDVLLSSFSSAGQRCSALRILFLPEVIADEVLELASNAAGEMEVGNPWNLKTDIGPVIDETAKANLQKHIDYLENSKGAKLIYKLKINDLEKDGSFFAPQIWEIDDLDLLQGENFGPILHVFRYKNGENLIQKINDLKFGLTFGMHTRIHDQYKDIEKRINAGNIYINRNITGAIVESQPFGGEGLSGTGFKAGGPHYLLKFISERTLSINVSAIGGNIDLLMKS
ncbi:MAG: RHH-type proline utilization regulon transcriptional repressor/proline dehydrogenase [Rickettsiales bacterium]|jgi:RHH-type proline utilization regulon transcriptional repressor/proline dehydrogenase/delta 1-pyrroline-5-carboxylate dehydrogenase